MESEQAPGKKTPNGDQDQIDAAVKIQAATRGRSERKHHQEQVDAAVKIQAAARDRSVQKKGTAASKGKVKKEGNESTVDEEMAFKKKIKETPAGVRKMTIKKVGKAVWQDMSWKERYEAVQLELPEKSTPPTAGVASPTKSAQPPVVVSEASVSTAKSSTADAPPAST